MSAVLDTPLEPVTAKASTEACVDCICLGSGSRDRCWQSCFRLSCWSSGIFATVWAEVQLDPAAKRGCARDVRTSRLAASTMTPYSGTLLTHLLASVGRVYGGFAIAVAVAIPLGLMIGRIALVRGLLDPTLQILRPIPVTAWLPLAMIMFGLGPRSAFFLVCLGAFYPVLVNTIFGVRSVDPRIVRGGQHARLSGHRRSSSVSCCRRACLRSLPACGWGLAFAWVVIVVGEMTGVQTGLGAIIMEARQLSRTEIVISGMIMIGIAGFLSGPRGHVWLGQRLLRWSPNFV